MDVELTDQFTESIDELVNKLKQLPLMTEDQQNNLIKEFVKNEYFKRCDFESNIDLVVFYLLNYAISLDEIISEDVLKLLRDLFSHIDHCFFATKNKDHNCKISSRLYRSNWLKVYFESVSKVYEYNFNLMNDQLIEFMYVLFKKTPNKQALNLDYLTVVNFLISNTTHDLIKNEDEAKKKKPILCEKKHKIILLIILILDGQYQPFLDKIQLKKVAKFLDMNGIRMYWQNLNEFENVKAHLEDIVKFCKNLIESHNDLNDVELE